MRTLCLDFKTPQESSAAEAFLLLSPRVQFRFPHFIFIDIDSTAHLFGGEQACLSKALQIAQKFSIQSSGAIADSPATAQMMARWKPSSISPKGQDSKSFQGLGLDALKDLEGLMPWSQKKLIEHVISFARTLGICTLEEIYNLRLVSLRERWGDFGALLWNRLHNQETQVISPLIPRDPLTAYGYLDDPLSTVGLLFNHIKVYLDGLFARLNGLCRFAQKLEVILYCEYSEQKFILLIEPVSPSRDSQLFEDLLFKRMEKTELTNPIREFEISIYDVAEKIQQLDFFEPRDNSEDRWRRLISFAKQANCEMGFLQLEAHHFPEKSFKLVTEWPKDFKSEDLVERQEYGLQVKTSYAKGLAQSPRPSLLLEQPQSISHQDLKRMHFLSKLPNERIESSWWQFANPEFKFRDYYFALSHQGQMLWVFQDRMSSQYYLHGYFD
jgi:protein ImuB